ncbi:hypothetical protein WAF17_05230 [Bernardetia sp. ABR2-2B]|uniref:tetratricopeptide repeat protein n=1 Tax=Bernardetia sp. ABR2-2B TaxID=3127472 RepID=UPI0030D08724
MKRHQEILEIIGGLIGLGVLCFFAYKAYTIIIQFPVFFSVLGGLLIVWLIYNFRITAARISIYFNPKIAYNLLKNHLEKDRVVALKKYIFSKAVYHIFYKASKNEQEKSTLELQKVESYLTESLELLEERNRKVKDNIDKKKSEEMTKEWKYLFEGRPQQKELESPFFMIKSVFTYLFKAIKWFIPIASRVIALYFHYSFMKSTKVHYYRGAVRAALKKHELSLEDFEVCIETDYEKAYSLYGKVYALSGLERYQEALIIIEETLEIDKKFNQAIYKRGSIQNKLGNKEAACEDWKLAIEYGYKEDEKEKEKRKEKCSTC